MLRVVLAVAMAAALLAASLPAVETARVHYGDEQTVGELEALEAAATTLAERNDPPPPGVAGPRRTVTLSLPEGTWSAAGLERLRIDPDTRSESYTPVRWRVDGGTGQTRQLRGNLTTVESKPLAIDDGGRQRLVLELRADGSVRLGRPTP